MDRAPTRTATASQTSTSKAGHRLSQPSQPGRRCAYRLRCRPSRPQYAVFAVVISQAAAERLAVPVEEIAGRIAARHSLELTA